MNYNPRQLLIIILLTSVLIGSVRIWLELPTYDSSATWWEISLNLAEGKGYVACFPSYFPSCRETEYRDTAAREPLPVLLLAATIETSDNPPLIAALIQLVFYSLILLGVFTLTYDLGGMPSALLSAVFWMLYLPAIRLIPHASGDMLVAVFVTWGTWAIVRGRRYRRIQYWALAGVCFGLGALTRSVTLVLIAAVILSLIPWSAVLTREIRFRWSFQAGELFVFTMTAFSIISPWIVRNYLTFGQFVPGTTLTGYNLYRHNYIVATNSHFHYVGPDEAQRAIDNLVSQRSVLLYIHNEAEVDAFFRHEAIGLISRWPMRYVQLSLFRNLPLWFNLSIPEAYGKKMSLLDYLIIGQQIFLLLTSLIGLQSNWKKARPLMLVILVTVAAHLAVNGLLRYIVMIMPLLISLSALGVVWLIQRLGTSGGINLYGRRGDTITT